MFAAVLSTVISTAVSFAVLFANANMAAPDGKFRGRVVMTAFWLATVVLWVREFLS